MSAAQARPGVFVGWACSDVVSVFGSRLAALAVPWFVLTTTGSAAQTGLVALAQLAPMVVAKALAGPLLDRIGPARAAIGLDAASALVTALIPAFAASGWLNLPVLLAVVATLGALRGPADAAKYALVPGVARASGQPLERVTGIGGTTERLASSVGAAGGGVLIAMLGAPQALMATALGFVFSAALIGWLVGPRLVPAADDAATGSESRGYRRDLADGWSFLRRDGVLLSILVMVAVTNLFDQAWVVILVPVWATSHGHGAEVVGLLFATMTGAAVLGSLLATVLGARMPRLPVYAIGYLLSGLPRYLVFAFDAGPPVVLTVLVAAGVASGVLNPIISAVQFERIPGPLVGRVSSLITAGAWALMPFGGLLGGLLTTRIGFAPAMLGLAGAYLVVTLAPLILPAFRAMGAPTHDAQGQPGRPRSCPPRVPAGANRTAGDDRPGRWPIGRRRHG